MDNNTAPATIYSVIVWEAATGEVNQSLTYKKYSQAFALARSYSNRGYIATIVER